MTAPSDVYLATLGTASFDFSAVGRTEIEARDGIRRAWLKHRADSLKQSAGLLAAPHIYTWSELADDVNVLRVRIGAGYRDGFEIVKPERHR